MGDEAKHDTKVERSVMTRVSNCRNFKCPSNRSGVCIEDHIELVPVGGLIDHLICVQATEAEEVRKTASTKLAAPEPSPDQ